jgi:hypothetical protein
MDVIQGDQGGRQACLLAHNRILRQRHLDLPALLYLSVATPLWPSVGGEAQHLEKLGTWSPPGLPNIQSSTTRPKTPRIEAFLVSLKRS